MLAAGSMLTNKYAEGYPAHRYYGGCQYVDIVETLAIERAKKLFGAEHANVQPHSGANANFAVYFAVLQPGDTIMGMSLAHGGHLTHGSSVTVSGKYFNSVGYGVSEATGMIDYDDLEQKVLEVKEIRITPNIEKHDFEFYNKDVLIAVRKQFPLRLAYGITIHKSQGMSLDKLAVDCSRIFEEGQAYVAISRIKTLEGLYLYNFTPKKVMVDGKVVEFYQNLNIFNEDINSDTLSSLNTSNKRSTKQLSLWE
jgi:hypothetical protein